MSVNELAEFVHPVTSRWWSGESNARTIAAALRFMGVESHQEQRDRAIADTKKPFKTRQNCRRYNTQEALRALIAHYDGVAQHAKRWNDLARERADVLRKHLEDNYPKGISITDIQKMLEDRSIQSVSGIRKNEFTPTECVMIRYPYTTFEKHAEP